MNDDDGNDGGQLDRPHALQAAGTVDFRGLVQFWRHVGERGQVDDGAPAEALPDAGADVHIEEGFRNGKRVGGLCAGERLVNHAVHAHVRVKQLHQHADQHDGGDEVGNVGDRLHDLLVALGVDGVEQKREQDGKGHAEDHRQDGDPQGVHQHAGKDIRAEEPLKMTQANPRAAEETLVIFEVFERELNAYHRRVFEGDNVGQRNKQKQIQLPVALQCDEWRHLLTHGESSSVKQFGWKDSGRHHWPPRMRRKGFCASAIICRRSCDRRRTARPRRTVQDPCGRARPDSRPSRNPDPYRR